MIFFVNIFKRLIFFICTFTFVFTNVIAQINIKYPAERSVFQRNNSNLGSIQVSGLLDKDADRVEGRLVPRSDIQNQGEDSNWQTIDNSIDGQSFTGKIDGKGGWYSLEIRTVKNDLIIDNARIERVGIGEVFVVAGQSNAQGDGRTPNPNGATDDRVNCLNQNYYDQSTSLFRFFPELIPVDQFSQISRSQNIGPIGYGPWCYAELGDKLVKKLNVPVMFYNAALSGTSSFNWAQSLNGSDTFHKFVGYRLERGMPYAALRRTLHGPISLYGIRTILWHQGEFDLDTGEQTYVDNINRVIQETRNNTGEKIPWMIARASRLAGNNYQQIINAQTRLVSPNNMIFGGPFTDNIQPFRPDQAHFENTNSIRGLSLLAEEWSNSLNETFFANSSPIQGKQLIEIKYSCINDNAANFFIDRSFNSYLWNTNATSNSIQANNGEVAITTRDNAGNYYYSSKQNVRNIYPKDRPSISAVGGLRACEGKTIDILAVPSKYDVNWNNGLINNKLTVSLNVPYFARFRTAQGCFSANSESLIPVFVKPPQKPTFKILGEAYVCKGAKIEIQVDNPNLQDNTVLWNNSLTTNKITLSDNTILPLKVKLSSAKDCDSPESDVVPYIFIENPKTPVVIQSGPFSVKAKVEDKPVNYEWFFDKKLIQNQTSQDILIKTNGFYSVKAVNNFKLPTNKLLECKSPFSTDFTYTKNEKLFGISVFPNPILDGRFFLASEKELKNVKVELINTHGKVFSEGNLADLKIPIEFNVSKSLLGGKYYLKVYYDGLSRVFPLVFE
jgi:Carbohydrate esterase, sialic acid-specific acetylesterase